MRHVRATGRPTGRPQRKEGNATADLFNEHGDGEVGQRGTRTRVRWRRRGSSQTGSSPSG